MFDVTLNRFLDNDCKFFPKNISRWQYKNQPSNTNGYLLYLIYKKNIITAKV